MIQPLIFISWLVLSFPKVGHTKAYVQVLIVAQESMLGTSAIVKITSVGRWSVFGEVIETVNQINHKSKSVEKMLGDEKCSPCSDSCACSSEPEPCACGPESCGGQNASEQSDVLQNDVHLEDQNRRTLVGWLLRKRKIQAQKMVENGVPSGSQKKQQEWAKAAAPGEWGVVDRAVLGGLIVSIFSTVALLIHLGFKTMSSKWATCVAFYLSIFLWEDFHERFDKEFFVLWKARVVTILLRNSCMLYCYWDKLKVNQMLLLFFHEK